MVFFFCLQYNICKKKLNSKREALKILTSDLELCQRERDIYKTKIKQLVSYEIIGKNTPCSYMYSRYWTGTNLHWRLMLGNVIERDWMSFAYKNFLTISLMIPRIQMCGSRKYPYLHHVENWNKGWRVKDPRNSGREGCYGWDGWSRCPLIQYGFKYRILFGKMFFFFKALLKLRNVKNVTLWGNGCW